jgi:hypothetical protein
MPKLGNIPYGSHFIFQKDVDYQLNNSYRPRKAQVWVKLGINSPNEGKITAAALHDHGEVREFDNETIVIELAFEKQFN